MYWSEGTQLSRKCGADGYDVNSCLGSAAPPTPSGLPSVVPQPLQLPAHELEALVMRLPHHLMCWNSLEQPRKEWGWGGVY